MNPSRPLPTIASLALALTALALAGCSQLPGPAPTAPAARPAPSDWPQWRGPARDGHSPDRGLLGEWPEGGPPLAWQSSGLGGG